MISNYRHFNERRYNLNIQIKLIRCISQKAVRVLLELHTPILQSFYVDFNGNIAYVKKKDFKKSVF